MKFCCFTPVPWPDLDRRPDAWPFPSDTFDASRCATCYDAAIEQLVYAEQCGFDWVGMGEDHMTAYGLTPNPLLLLSVVAARTQRVKLVTMGTPLPLLNPIRVAEEMAMLDIQSRGRVIAGLIRGVPQNYSAYNINPHESRSRFNEAIKLVTKAWTHPETFAWDGEFYQFPKVSLWPRPFQDPHPPYLLSANSVTSAEQAAHQRAMIGAIHLYNRDAIDRIGESFDAYRSIATADNWVPHPDTFTVGLQTCIASTDQEAFDKLRPALDYQYTKLSGTFNNEKRKIAAAGNGYGLSPTEENPPTLEERLEAQTVLCGSPETVVNQIKRLQDTLGAGVISMHLQVGNMPFESVHESMTLFAQSVRPVFPITQDIPSETRV
ncbi:MAG: LLM class flavin-dependent oxidoreductase [Phycisphaerales bacterium]|nr:LLM class flavin-dependent oxidoreductase [Phycisphaerales bacterium]